MPAPTQRNKPKYPVVHPAKSNNRVIIISIKAVIAYSIMHIYQKNFDRMITGNVFVLLILAGNCVNIIIYEQKGVSSL